MALTFVSGPWIAAISSAISMLAPSIVPIIREPFIWNFIFEVPEASVPAVLIC